MDGLYLLMPLLMLLASAASSSVLGELLVSAPLSLLPLSSLPRVVLGEMEPSPPGLPLTLFLFIYSPSIFSLLPPPCSFACVRPSVLARRNWKPRRPQK